MVNKYDGYVSSCFGILVWCNSLESCNGCYGLIGNVWEMIVLVR